MHMTSRDENVDIYMEEVLKEDKRASQDKRMVCAKVLCLGVSIAQTKAEMFRVKGAEWCKVRLERWVVAT